VAWQILPPLLALLPTLAPAVPRGRRVLVLATRGRWSPRRSRHRRPQHWQALLRLPRAVRV